MYIHLQEEIYDKQTRENIIMYLRCSLLWVYHKEDRLKQKKTLLSQQILVVAKNKEK